MPSGRERRPGGPPGRRRAAAIDPDDTRTARAGPGCRAGTRGGRPGKGGWAATGAAKLWSVIPKLFEWPPLRSAAHALERLSLLLLVGGAGFTFATGILNIQLDYVFPGSFYTLHFYGAWVFVAAFIVHVAFRLPRAARTVRAGRGWQPAPDSPEAAGLPYPGGPAIDRAARGGNGCAVAFPRPLTRPGDAPYAFSFSGLKTAAARWAEQHRIRGEEIPLADGAASLQEAVADVLMRKALAACKEYGVRTLVVVGGVAANSRVRALADERCAAAGVELRVPPLTLCTDHGAMIAAVGDLLVRAGSAPAQLDMSIDPSAPLEYAALHPVARTAARAA
ncbi:hypothetical protein [Streptomyces sp. NBC_00096]|uniref:hypothetical protein n=1 Tax=Streptomyces sp. NBC_00096 TaxID=2975650 RepID=UPI0032437A9E